MNPGKHQTNQTKKQSGSEKLSPNVKISEEEQHLNSPETREEKVEVNEKTKENETKTKQEKEERLFKPHNRPLQWLTVTPNEKCRKILTYCNDGTLRLWNYGEKEKFILRAFTCNNELICNHVPIFLTNNGRLAFINNGIFDLYHGKLLSYFKHNLNKETLSIKYFEDDRNFLSLEKNGEIRCLKKGYEYHLDQFFIKDDYLEIWKKNPDYMMYQYKLIDDDQNQDEEDDETNKIISKNFCQKFCDFLTCKKKVEHEKDDSPPIYDFLNQLLDVFGEDTNLIFKILEKSLVNIDKELFDESLQEPELEEPIFFVIDNLFDIN